MVLFDIVSVFPKNVPRLSDKNVFCFNVLGHFAEVGDHDMRPRRPQSAADNGQSEGRIAHEVRARVALFHSCSKC